MRSLLIFFIPLLILTGCGGNKPYVIKEASTVGSVGSSTVVVIVDQRPEDDKKFSFGSMLVFNDNYGIWTLGDTQFSPELPELLKSRVHKQLATLDAQPKRVEITLNRMIIQSNHQADLLQSVSTNGSLGPLGVLIAETMHGKEFELDYDKTRPFVMGLIKADIRIEPQQGDIQEQSVFISKIENFSHHMDFKGREKAAINVATELADNFATSF